MSVQKLAIIKDMISKNIQTEKNKFDCLMKEIEMFSKILPIYSKLNGYKRQDARLAYLDYLKNFVLYLSQQYFVKVFFFVKIQQK